MKLYATLETSRGRKVSISDNEEIIATVYDGNKKAYSVIIEWTNLGDIEKPTMGALVRVREWRNASNEKRGYSFLTSCRRCKQKMEGKKKTATETTRCTHCDEVQ